MDKKKVFEKELGWIMNPKIKAFAEKLVECAPDYFFECAASSTSKYHPQCSLGPGGLVRHSKFCAALLNEFLSWKMFNKYNQDKKDMMMIAMIAHDFFKHGLPEKMSKYTVAEHPEVCCNFIRNNPELTSMLEPDQISFITECILKHMGPFGTDFKTGKKILPEPETGPENLVHMCDMLSSRRWLNIDFGDDYYEPAKPEPAAPVGDPELDRLKADIVEKCKAKIETGISNKDIYAMIAAENNGNRNPNSIIDLTVAKNVLHKLEEMNV